MDRTFERNPTLHFLREAAAISLSPPSTRIRYVGSPEDAYPASHSLATNTRYKVNSGAPTAPRRLSSPSYSSHYAASPIRSLPRAPPRPPCRHQTEHETKRLLPQDQTYRQLWSQEQQSRPSASTPRYTIRQTTYESSSSEQRRRRQYEST
jgi:hypothetical protein